MPLVTDAPWGPGTTIVSGDVPRGRFDFKRSEVAPGRVAPMATYAFDGATAREAAVDLTDVVLTVQNSLFEDSSFRQLRRPASDGTWGQGSLARRPSVYRRCTFDGVRFRIRGGFSVGVARFEQCSFRRCDFGEHFSFCADYIDCVFIGPIKRAVFYGAAPDGHWCDGKVNILQGNDFSEAELRDVAFRGGVDLAAQRWSEGLDPTAFIDV